VRLARAAILVGTLAYSQFAINAVLREPAPQAAAALRAQWDRQFACGPAYVLGDTRSARALAIYYGGAVHGVGFADVDRRAWYDPEEAARRGAIIIAPAEFPS